jgi:hypothetical protein
MTRASIQESERDRESETQEMRDRQTDGVDEQSPGVLNLNRMRKDRQG